MDPLLLKLMHETEDSWWYRGRASVISALFSRFLPKTAAEALDMGAGYGGMKKTLASRAERVFAFEPDTDARQALAARGYSQIFETVDEALTREYGIIALFDVIEHIEEDVSFLKRLRASLLPGGTIVLTAPAYQWLWSVHDKRNRHYRRYTKGRLVLALQSAGFRVSYAGYWNASLFPLAVVVRLLGRSGEEGLSAPSWVNALLYAVIRVEAAVMRFIPLPFGLSVVAVAVNGQ